MTLKHYLSSNKIDGEELDGETGSSAMMAVDGELVVRPNDSTSGRFVLGQGRVGHGESRK
jgi:hypothetical protein